MPSEEEGSTFAAKVRAEMEEERSTLAAKRDAVVRAEKEEEGSTLAAKRDSVVRAEMEEARVEVAVKRDAVARVETELFSTMELLGADLEEARKTAAALNRALDEERAHSSWLQRRLEDAQADLREERLQKQQLGNALARALSMLREEPEPPPRFERPPINAAAAGTAGAALRPPTSPHRHSSQEVVAVDSTLMLGDMIDEDGDDGDDDDIYDGRAAEPADASNSASPRPFKPRPPPGPPPPHAFVATEAPLS